MANIKSSAKRDLKSKELRAKNRAEKTALKTTMKKFEVLPARACCTRTMRHVKSPRWPVSSTA